MEWLVAWSSSELQCKVIRRFACSSERHAGALRWEVGASVPGCTHPERFTFPYMLGSEETPCILCYRSTNPHLHKRHYLLRFSDDAQTMNPIELQPVAKLRSPAYNYRSRYLTIPGNHGVDIIIGSDSSRHGSQWVSSPASMMLPLLQLSHRPWQAEIAYFH